MRSHINIAVPHDADPEMTEKLFAAIREKHVGYEIRTTESTNGKYHWGGGFIHITENATIMESHINEHGELVGSQHPAPVDPLARDVALVIRDVTGDER